MMRGTFAIKAEASLCTTLSGISHQIPGIRSTTNPLLPPTSRESSCRQRAWCAATVFGPSAIFSTRTIFPSVPFHGGFGLLNIHGIAKPTYRAFQILHALGTDLLAVEGSCGTVDAWAVRKAHAVAILLTNHAMPRHSIHTQEVGVRVTSAQKPRLCYVERIDDDHANPRRRWESMGKPTYLSAKQLDDLQHASLVRKDPQSWTYSHQSIDFKITLPPHSVAAVTMEFA